MADSLGEQDALVTLIEMESTQYRVEMYGGSVDPFTTYVSRGSWSIEGDFLIIWDTANVRHAYRIPAAVQYIKTVEMPHGPLPLAEDYAESAE